MYFQKRVSTLEAPSGALKIAVQLATTEMARKWSLVNFPFKPMPYLLECFHFFCAVSANTARNLCTLKFATTPRKRVTLTESSATHTRTLLSDPR